VPHYRWIKHLLVDGHIGMPYSSTPPVPKIVRGQSAAEELAVPDSYFTGADRSASLRSSQSDPGCRRHPRGPPLRPDFDDGPADQCVVEAALITERTSMGLAPGAELSVLRRRSRTGSRSRRLREAGLEQDAVSSRWVRPARPARALRHSASQPAPYTCCWHYGRTRGEIRDQRRRGRPR
jgi:hypothetical protein